MIERIVIVKLKPELSTPEGRQEIAEHSHRILAALPGVDHVHVGVAADETTAAEWDLCLTLRFVSADLLEPYRLHPDHRAYVDEYLRPRMTGIRAFNFELVD